MNTRYRDLLLPTERDILDPLDTPGKIQRFLNTELTYMEGGGFHPPREVLTHRRAQCYSGSVVGALALAYHGYGPPRIVDLRARRDAGGPLDDDHVIAVYTIAASDKEFWGAVAKSNFTGLRRRTVCFYRSLGELARSYADFYFNTEGDLTLESYSDPLDLEAFGDGWLTASAGSPLARSIEEALENQLHYSVVEPGMERYLEAADPTVVAAGLRGANRAGLFRKDG